jgi:activating signal cointegrator 1
MKALTIRQPWASLIAAGIKTVETRSRRTNYRGPIVIHAGKTDTDNAPGVHPYVWDRLSDVIGGAAPVRGAGIAVADLVDCVPIVAESGTFNDEFYVCIDGRLERQTDHHPEYGNDAWPEGRLSYEDHTGQLPFGDFTPGRWAWLLANIRPLATPVPVPGAQGIWNLPTDVETAVTEQLAVTA